VCVVVRVYVSVVVFISESHFRLTFSESSEFSRVFGNLLLKSVILKPPRSPLTACHPHHRQRKHRNTPPPIVCLSQLLCLSRMRDTIFFLISFDIIGIACKPLQRSTSCEIVTKWRPRVVQVTKGIFVHAGLFHTPPRAVRTQCASNGLEGSKMQTRG